MEGAIHDTKTLDSTSNAEKVLSSQMHTYFVSQKRMASYALQAYMPLWAGLPTPQKPYPPATCAAGAGPGAVPGAGPEVGPGAGRFLITAERRYQGRSPKPPPVWAGSRLSKGLGVAAIAFSLFQSMVLFTVFRSVCHGRLWSPNQSYLQNSAAHLTNFKMKSELPSEAGLLLESHVQLLANS